MVTKKPGSAEFTPHTMPAWDEGGKAGETPLPLPRFSIVGGVALAGLGYLFGIVTRDKFYSLAHNVPPEAVIMAICIFAMIGIALHQLRRA